MGTWEYRLASKDTLYKEILAKEYGILEVHYNDKLHPEGVSDFIDPNNWEDVEDLRITLTKMLKALVKPIFCHISQNGEITYHEKAILS